MSDQIDRQAAIDAFDCSVGGVPVESVKYVSEYADKMMNRINALPSAQPEWKKDIIQKFHDYQVEWLTSHCDLELEQTLEEWVVRFLHDTANCFMMEMERGEQYESD